MFMPAGSGRKHHIQTVTKMKIHLEAGGKERKKFLLSSWL